jgi:hypothetical protein
VVSQCLTQMVLVPVFALIAVNKSQIWVVNFNSCETDCLEEVYHRPLMWINAKKQSIKRIVDMVAQNIGQSKLSSKRIEHEHIDMVAQKNGQSKMSSRQIKHEATHTLAVTINNASRNKIVTKNSGAKQSPEQVQPVIKVNIFIHDFILHKNLSNFIFG